MKSVVPYWEKKYVFIFLLDCILHIKYDDGCSQVVQQLAAWLQTIRSQSPMAICHHFNVFQCVFYFYFYFLNQLKQHQPH